MASDIEIAQKAKLRRISELAQERLGIAEEHLEPTGTTRPSCRSTTSTACDRAPTAS